MAPPPASPPPPPATLVAAAARLGVTLDGRAVERFGRYLDLLLEWSPRAGLTSVTDRDEVQRRHFAESLAVLRVLRDAGAVDPRGTSIVDIGAGAGLPGLPMRIVEPALRLTLVESNARRCRFLELVVAELALDGVTVVRARAEEAGRDPALRGTFDLAVARAVAPLPVLVEYALPLLRSGGLLAASKGSGAEEELAGAAAAIAALGGVTEPSLALPPPGDAAPPHPQRLVLVRRTGELDDRYPRRPGMPAKRPLR